MRASGVAQCENRRLASDPPDRADYERKAQVARVLRAKVCTYDILAVGMEQALELGRQIGANGVLISLHLPDKARTPIEDGHDVLDIVTHVPFALPLKAASLVATKLGAEITRIARSAPIEVLSAVRSACSYHGLEKP